MKENFLAALIAKGLTQEQATIYANLIIIEKEEEIATKVDEIMSAIPTQPTQSEIDKRVTQAVQTTIANYEKKHNLKDGKKIETPTTSPTSPTPIDNKDDKINKLTETVEKLAGIVTEFSDKQKKEERSVFVKKALTDAKIPDSMHKRFIDNPEATDDEFVTLVNDYKQELADLGIATLQSPGNGGSKNMTEVSAEKAAKSRNGELTETGGVKAKEL